MRPVIPAVLALAAVGALVVLLFHAEPAPRAVEPLDLETALDEQSDSTVRRKPVLVRSTIGRSAEGRPIRLLSPRPVTEHPVLVVGCIHGDECAGTAVVRELARRGLLVRGQIVAVPSLNPDGAELGTRTNARGVDLNRNFGAGWTPNGVPGDPEHSGAEPFSEPETRAARELIRSVRPRLTIWFHQQAEELVRAWGPSRRVAAAYARRADLPFVSLPWILGGASNWQHARFPGSRAFVAEIADGTPVPAEVMDHVSAIAALAGTPLSPDREADGRP